MPQAALLLPPRRSELVMRPLGERGRYVVKDPLNSSYFHIGEQEHFLLLQLDGQADAERVCQAFEARFGQPLSGDDLEEFVGLARRRGLLRTSEPDSSRAEVPGDRAAPERQSATRLSPSGQSIL